MIKHGHDRLTATILQNNVHFVPYLLVWEILPVEAIKGCDLRKLNSHRTSISMFIFSLQQQKLIVSGFLRIYIYYSGES